MDVKPEISPIEHALNGYELLKNAKESIAFNKLLPHQAKPNC
jgi:hypothetical protein